MHLQAGNDMLATRDERVMSVINLF